jgi:hypothetical protein
MSDFSPFDEAQRERGLQRFPQALRSNLRAIPYDQFGLWRFSARSG